MARSNRRTVQVALLGTMLASTGAGTYYTIQSGVLPSQLFGRAELVADDVAPDALPIATPVDEVADASESRYAAVPTETINPITPPAESEVEPAVADSERYSVTPVAPVALTSLPAGDVTRGQAPNELDGQADDLAAAEPLAAVNDPVAAPTVESSRRAREAFADDVAAASATMTGDRYGAPAAVASAPAAVPASAAAVPAATAGNPFAAAPETAATPATAAPAAEYQPAELHTASAAYRDTATIDSAGRTKAERDPLAGDNATAAPAGEGTGRPGERALEGQQRPALVIQKFAPPEIQVGKAAKFAVQVRNVGTQTAENVVIRDEVPHGTRVVNTTPRATNEGAHLVWELGALSSGEERTVEIELMPTSEGEIGSVATVAYSAQASAKTRCTMPQLAIRMTAPKQVMIGQEQRVKIELRNPGTGDATGVMLLENVPENVKHAAGPALEFEVGTLRAGETREMELVLTAEKAGPVVNTLTARAEGGLQVQQQVEFEVIAPALQLSVEGPEKRFLERPATYQVIIENPGTAPAHDIELVTKLPKGLQFVKANNMGEYDASTHSVYWSLAQLPEGEKGSVELVAMPVEAGQQTIQIQGKAQQGLSDEVKREVQVEGLAAIMFEVRDAEDPIEVGGETTYEIRVINQGSKAATNVQVVAQLPSGLEVISASGEAGHSVQARGVVFEPLAQLAPKTDSVYRIQVKGVQPGDQRVTVQVSTDDISQPIRREESTRVFGDE